MEVVLGGLQVEFEAANLGEFCASLGRRLNCRSWLSRAAAGTAHEINFQPFDPRTPWNSGCLQFWRGLGGLGLRV